jgi:enoyl-CoA hydratase/carnithine racemase
MTRIHSNILAQGNHAESAWISVDNHEKINILDRAAMEDLRAAIAAVSQNPALRVMVLRGAGDQAFIGGADIREMVQLNPDSAEQFITCLHQVCAALRAAPVPVIARISGYCLGAGLEIAASCDIRIAADNAVFGMPEVRVGIPSVIEAALLPRLIGWGKTSRLLYSGETIDAEQALSWGLVEQVTAAAELDQAIESMSAAICAAGAQAIRAQKTLLRQWETLPLEQAIEQAIIAFREAFSGDEPQRLMQTFLNRRKT